ncbi:hypothetical protein YA0783_22965 [Pseudomonas corrugata]|uniref:hypothetical protein n=1 Tax=Pseudomonas corrugata TaxID=47879 RepID=UPI0018E5F0B1|nr:hypothetical protein [Pseudomonas corrugata]MBI6621164.1 hypothetical protein [Pseudomonas corrugata]MBI6693730.1 hypothetical protein [Pseudomonas corrugata]
MSTAPVKSLIDEQIEELPADRMILAFTHEKWLGALSLAHDAGIPNVHAWSGRACLCGEWTVAYAVKVSP